jgi:VanZ family protein
VFLNGYYLLLTFKVYVDIFIMKYFLFFMQRYWFVNWSIVFVSIGLLSLWPLEKLPSAPGSDKLHHLIAYAALVFPIVLRKPRLWLFLVFFCIAYGGVIELVQPFVNRYGEWLDMVANSTGVICGVLFAEMARQWMSGQQEG